MKLREIWKKYNVSTLLVLPIYSDICKNSKLILDKRVVIPFIQLCLECGLEQTYLEEDRFILKFDSKVIDKNELTETTGFSLAEAIIGSDFFAEILAEGVFSLSLPQKYLNDLNLIRDSKYSKLSLEYKRKLMISQESVAILSNELSNSIVIYNLPYSIVVRAKHLRKELSNALNISESIMDSELYSKFDKNKEQWDK